MEQIELIRAKPEDAALVHALQLEAFWPLYQIYQDDETSPAKESTERILEKITDPDGDGQLRHRSRQAGRYTSSSVRRLPRRSSRRQIPRRARSPA